MHDIIIHKDDEICKSQIMVSSTINDLFEFCIEHDRTMAVHFSHK